MDNPGVIYQGKVIVERADIIGHALKSHIDRFGVKHQFLSTPQGAKNRCVDASMMFLKWIGAPESNWHALMASNSPKVEGKWHAWVNLDGLNIDWTARQYDPQADFPKVWFSKT